MRRSVSVGLLLVLGGCAKGDDPNGDDRTRVTILHTNDWQSHMLGRGPNSEYTPDIGGDDSTLGGLARVSTLVSQIRSASPHPVVLYDAGDWMSGALFQTLATSHAAELSVMDTLGFDATTLGNHEFDWGPEVLGEMIAKADDLGVTVPIVASNLSPSMDPSDDALEAHFDSGRIQFTRTDTLDNGVTVGLFGLLGAGAQLITPGLGDVSYTMPAEAASEAVAQLEDADLVVALTHSGVDEDRQIFGDQVAGVDVVVGGHSHTALFEYETTSQGTVVVQAGAYTLYLGQLDLVMDADEWSVERYQLHPIDDRLPGDPRVNEMVSDYVAAIDAQVLAPLDLSFSQPIASIPEDLPRDGCQELGLSHLVTDAYREQINLLAPSDPVSIAAEAQGVIRDPLDAGSGHIQAFSDFFRVLPLGGGDDDVPGYALTSFYLTGAEIADACEVTASLAPEFSCSFFIEISGARCHADMDAPLYSRVSKVEISDGDGWVDLDIDEDNPTLIHVAANTYVADLMELVGTFTFGTLRVTPKHADGTEVVDLSTRIIDADPMANGIQEYKAWQAVVDFAGSFSDTDGDGIPDVPVEYASFEPRLVGYEMSGDGHL